MKKIMILGASILQLPAICKAKERGFQVIAVDMDKNAIGFKEADICLVISTIDIPKVVEAARQYNVDGIMTLASDMPMRTVAAAAKALNIIGIDEETALKATNKALMRECLRENHVQVPAFFKVESIEEYLKIVKHFRDRFIVKPIDNSGSRGVILVDHLKDINLIIEAFYYSKKNSRSGGIIVEEYMKGYEVSVETLTIKGRTHVIAITDKLTSGAPYFVEMGHSIPSVLPGEILTEIKKVAISAVEAIGIDKGPSHVEIIVTEEGPKIVELGARLGGDNITTHLVPLATGVDMVECSLNIALGLGVDINVKFSKGAAIRYFKHVEGYILSIEGIEKARSLEGIQEIKFTKKAGDFITPIRGSGDRMGYVIAQARTADEAVQICNRAVDLIKINT